MEQSEYREFFSTLANVSRMAIVQLLRRRGATVTEIADTLNFEQSRVSHSLARLQRAGIVSCRWEDKRKIFHLVEEVAPLLREIEQYLERHPRKSAKAEPERAWAGWAVASSK